MRILFAEDDANISKIAQMVLERVGGHEVTLAEDGNSALDHLKKDRFDLVILDGMMPGLSGPEVCRKYLQQSHPAPVIFLSAKSSPQDICEFMDLGAGYIQKPFDPKTLCQQIDTIMKAAA